MRVETFDSLNGGHPDAHKATARSAMDQVSLSGSGQEANYDAKLRSQREPLIQETRNVEPDN